MTVITLTRWTTLDTADNPGDDVGTTVTISVAIAVRGVQAENAANTAPKFADDQDPNTSGKQADAERIGG